MPTSLTPPPSPLLKATGLAAGPDGRPIIHDIDLDVAAGEIVSIIGPNGAGKTTLLRALLGLMPVSAGRIERAADLRTGYVPQRLPLDPLLPITAGRFIALWGKAPQQAVAATGIARLLPLPLQKLSGGEMQLVLLAQALINRPNLLVLDEPAQALDLAGQRSLYEIIRQTRDRTGCGVLLVSHDLNFVMRQTDRVICLHGHICCQGKPEDVSQNPAYAELFGPTADAFALYHHHHDHDHHHD